ncbi:I17RC protein, partial [Baryphthengus martii]|nr:I17RC protein [Baryphthengus martii]
ADAKAWERLWARSQLVLHDTGQALSCSLSAPCDVPAELVPCWQPEPSRPCQALHDLQQPAVGQGPQEFARLRPHPNLCVQVWSGGQVRLTQCLRDREYCWGVMPGHSDDILLVEFGEKTNTSLCILERGACTSLASFASTLTLLLLQGVGRPGLLEQELQRDVAAGRCRQVSAHSRRAAGPDQAVCNVSLCPQLWHPENSTGTTFWACPLHKYLRTRWALAWMGVLLGATCLLLLLLLKKEVVKGEWCLSGGCTRPE